MSNTVISVQNLSKKYVITHHNEVSGGYRTFRGAIANAAASLAGVLNPAVKKQTSTKREEFWALKDVSFEIKQGDRVGIIGRNGAGKSTLLKILSRITEPTKGTIRIKGRIASLLEVGTGFHPELTGRENIFLNGAILGMSKAEIGRKFDEIVAFAEIEKFLDTPVKHYSSGMYVRLAFAVAAHLEPEILVVDEVLAVGDAQFQEKCLGKMKEVASQGRTVLFVSHSMEAISRLTNHCILLNKGSVHLNGNTERAVMSYLTLGKSSSEEPGYYQSLPKEGSDYVAWARVHTSHEQGIHRWGQPIKFEFALQVTEPQEGLCFSFQVMNHLQQAVFYHWFFESQARFKKEPGLFILTCYVPKLRLFMGTYTLTTWFSERRSNVLLESLSQVCSFEVTMQGFERSEYEWQQGDCVYIDDAVWEVAKE